MKSKIINTLIFYKFYVIIWKASLLKNTDTLTDTLKLIEKDSQISDTIIKTNDYNELIILKIGYSEL